MTKCPFNEYRTLSNNKVNLCDSCMEDIATCQTTGDDFIYGDGQGYDNICCCNKYKPLVSRRTWLDGELYRKKFL